MELEVPDEAESSEAGAVTAEAAWAVESGAAAGLAQKKVALAEAPSVTGQPGPGHGKRLGHRGVDASGETTYKKTTSSTLKGAIQLGIGYTVGNLSSKPERDVLMQDFYVVESIFFPSEGSNLTPAHHFQDFRFKTYAPVAFRYFRELFGIRPDDYLDGRDPGRERAWGATATAHRYHRHLAVLQVHQEARAHLESARP